MRHQHRFDRLNNSSWKTVGNEERLVQAALQCSVEGCDEMRWKMVGPWNRAKWMHRFKLKSRLHNPDCYFCRESHEPSGPGVCSRCGKESVRQAVVGHLFMFGGRRYSYLCHGCEEEFKDLFYGWLFEKSAYTPTGASR